MTRLSSICSLAFLLACGGVQERSDDNPVVETVEPTAGPLAGGTEVTLTGRNLDFSADTPTRVVIGDGVVDAAVVDDQTITFTTPPGDVGPAQIILFHGGGAVAVLQTFDYSPLPAIRSVAPPLATTGAELTIRGSGFELGNPGTVSVDLGGAPLENLTVVSDAVLTGTVPDAPGQPFESVDVTVTTNNGAATLAESFRFTGQGLLGVTNRRGPNGGNSELNRGRWFFIDTDTAQAVFLGRSVTPITKATVAANGDIFALADNVGFTQLGLFQADGLITANPRTLSVNFRAGDLVIDGNVLFALDRGGTQLRQFDLANGNQILAVAAQISARAQPACIFRNNATTLFVIENLDGSLSTINKTTGAVAAGATLNGPALACHGASRIGSDVFVVGFNVSNRQETRLFRLDVVGAQLTEIGPIEEDGQPVVIKSIVPTPPSF